MYDARSVINSARIAQDFSIVREISMLLAFKKASRIRHDAHGVRSGLHGENTR